MLPDRFGTYLVFAALLVVAPGPDFAVVVKNLLAGGRRRGLMTSLGVVSSNLVHGSFAAFGIGAVIVRSQALFTTIRWAGVVYLTYLGVQALRSAWRGEYPPLAAVAATPSGAGRRGWWQGFLSNITNPKVLAFYVSVLPQFMDAGASAAAGLVLAYTHALLSLVWLVVLVALLHRAARWLHRRTVRRALDAATGTALVGFGVALGAEST